MKVRLGIEAQRIFRTKKHGMDVYAHELIKALTQLSHAYEIIVFVRKDVEKEILKDFPQIKVISFSFPFGYLGWEHIALPFYCYWHRVQLLHCTSSTAPVLYFGKTVLTLHDIIFAEKPWIAKGSLYQKLGNIYRKLIVPIAAFKAQKVITVSYSERNIILQKLPFFQKKLYVIENGSTLFQAHENPTELPFSKSLLEQEFVLFLGNTDAKKNLDTLLLAFAEVLIEIPHLKLYIVDVQASFVQEKMKRLGIESIENNLVLLPYLSHTALGMLYRKAQSFIYPSIRESFGLPILEAMHCHCPVITSSISSMPEIAGNAALLVNPYDAQDIAIAIKTLYQHPDLKNKLVTLGDIRVQFYSWKKNAEKTLQIYSEALS
jgi:glycosyltransferase involved in cell wall biosynthesis